MSNRRKGLVLAGVAWLLLPTALTPLGNLGTTWTYVWLAGVLAWLISFLTWDKGPPE